MDADTYQIIDEPKPSRWSKYIVNPVLILLASILVPIIWSPPLAGRYWIPLVWLVINGLLLGSASWRKEIFYSLAGGLSMLACVYGSLFYFHNYQAQHLEQAIPYIRIALNGLMFLSLYLVVFTQATSYNLYQYIHDED